jgi:hypothetical protein
VNLKTTPPMRKNAICGHIMFLLVMLILGLGCDSFPVTVDYPTPSELSPTMSRLWARYSPYYPAAMYEAPPPGCDVVQVSLYMSRALNF